MLFTFSITAPANTPQTSPTKQTLKLHAGYITRISVLIPPGHAGLAHLALFDGETQVMPWGEGEWLEGDGETVVWEPDYRLPSEPARLEARVWNEDDTYAHTFYVRIWVNHAPAKVNGSLLEEGAKAISRFVKRVLGE